jgi:hypothetical protein
MEINLIKVEAGLHRSIRFIYSLQTDGFIVF